MCLCLFFVWLFCVTVLWWLSVCERVSFKGLCVVVCGCCALYGLSKGFYWLVVLFSVCCCFRWCYLVCVWLLVCVICCVAGASLSLLVGWLHAFQFNLLKIIVFCVVFHKIELHSLVCCCGGCLSMVSVFYFFLREAWLFSHHSLKHDYSVHVLLQAVQGWLFPQACLYGGSVSSEDSFICSLTGFYISMVIVYHA